MNPTLAVLLAFVASPAPNPRPAPVVKPLANYTLRVDSTDLSGWTIEIRVRNVSDTFRLAMAAHPEYDDRYWRYVTGFTAASDAGVATWTKADSAVWQVVAPPGVVRVTYRIALPPAEPGPRPAWRPFLTPTGGLVGGPHAFMYLLGAERLPVTVTLDLPRSWQIATGLDTTRDARTFTAANADALIDSPVLAGHLRQWRFVAAGVVHRIVYWPLPDATPFDTVAFVAGVEAVARQAVALFGSTPYRAYTFQLQDGARGGLEHRNSVSLGARSSELARDPRALLPETAHEFFHTWNLMQIRPVEYRSLDYRTQPPATSLWFSEGLTMFYADLLLRRAGVRVQDSTRTAHLERLLGRYLTSPAYSRFSAEAVSRVAYNAEPGALGDYSASTHLQGEILGTMLDLIIRDATGGRRSMDDVMRLLFTQSTSSPGIDGHAIEQAVETVCGCDVTPFFDAYVRNAGTLDVSRYLGLMGLDLGVTWAPAVYNGEPERDLRIFGWDSPTGLRVVISDPASAWGKAGLHSRDRLVTIDGAPVATWPELRTRLQRTRLGDTVRVEVQRSTGPFVATVVVTQIERPTVHVTPIANVSAAQRRVAQAWGS